MSFPPVRIHVLVVDDNPRDRSFITKMLMEGSPVQFEVAEAWNLEDTLARLNAGGIDLLLLDLNLPDSRGVDTLVKARDAAFKPPIIVVTGADDQKTTLHVTRNGAQGFLIKGRFDGPDLRSAIHAVLASSVAQAES